MKILTGAKDFDSEAFGLGLLVANICVVKRTERENDLNPRSRPDSRFIRTFLLLSCLLNNEQRIDLVDVTEAVTSDGR